MVATPRPVYAGPVRTRACGSAAAAASPAASPRVVLGGTMRAAAAAHEHDAAARSVPPSMSGWSSPAVAAVDQMAGIGLALQRRDGGVYIHEVIEGGAASRCPDEILPGDQIHKVSI